MTARNPGRHRASRRPITPLTPIARAAQEATASAARRGALLAAGSGLLVSAFAVPASAAPSTDHPKVSGADLSALTEPARQALSAAPAITVSADASFAIEQAPVTVTPAPEPEPEPEPEPVRQERATRSQDRTPTQAETSTAQGQTPVAAPPSAAGSSVVSVAMRYLGVPYQWGGTTPAGFDCSGFTSYVYAQVGINLPRTSSEQRYAGTVISREQAQPGDLVWSPGHIGIYAGDNMQVEAPSPGKTVRYGPIWQSNPTYIRVG
ncbi:C40 family peptidase (plasmid) [Cellulosimicrobium cellulans]|nr:C40 family peptidase [Cellulosimicrobium cellulans]QUC01950.1 C40 family peptidase [Cellulosimicrobium cellulans]